MTEEVNVSDRYRANHKPRLIKNIGQCEHVQHLKRITELDFSKGKSLLIQLIIFNRIKCDCIQVVERDLCQISSIILIGDSVYYIFE